jgi:hypothetical protein
VADLTNRFIIPSACICLFIENVTHVVADLINRFIIPSACVCLFIENVTHVVADLINRFVIPSAFSINKHIHADGITNLLVRSATT